MTDKQIKQKFKETYPDFMLGDEPLSPYFDIWEYGIEIATKELQEEINELKNIKDVADLLRLNNDTVITMCQLNNRFVSAENKLEKAKEIIREYIRLSLQEDKDIDENVKLFQKAEAFIKE